MKALLNWLDHRTGWRAICHEALFERVPGGARWRYVWGSTLTFAFFVQVVTGIFLWMAYSPSAQTAWESVYYLQHETGAGWLLRGVHHFTSQAMIVLLAVHLLQVVIDGAYKAPREVNFWLGLILMLIVLGLSLTGYLLPWDQKGYWATNVATEILGQTPLVGQQLQQLAVGGPHYGHHTLTRFFALHAGVLPALLLFFLVLHVALFRRHGLTARQPLKGPDQMFWPDQVLKDAVACLAVLLVVLLLAIHFNVPDLLAGRVSPEAAGAELGAPADGANKYDAARPEWYFLFLFQFLKYFPGRWEIVGAMIVPGVVLLTMFLMPWIGRSPGGHRFNVAFIVSLLVAITCLTLAALYDDYNAALFPNGAGDKHEASKRYLAAVADAKRDAERAKILASAPTGIPPAGAAALMRDDPKTQGPRLFALHCASCHTHLSPEAAATPEGESLLKAATAANLFGYGSRPWLHGLLDAKQIGGPGYFGGTKHKDGDMVNFVKGDLASTWKADQIAQVIAALSAEANLPAQRAQDEADIQPAAGLPAVIEAGRKLLGDDNRCAQCHKFHDHGELGAAPDLTGFASREWLTGLISDPAAERFYGKNNDRMPAFAAHPDDPAKNRLTQRELSLLVDWLRGEWYEPPQ